MKTLVVKFPRCNLVDNYDHLRVALFYLVHKWHLALLNRGTVIRLTFLDFRKAYDLIDHNLLLENCSKIGIRPGLLPWLASYLNGRAQLTNVVPSYPAHLQLIAAFPRGVLSVR